MVEPGYEDARQSDTATTEEWGELLTLTGRYHRTDSAGVPVNYTQTT